MIRLAESADAQALLDIYRYYVENTAITFECEVPSLAEFCQRIENISSRYPYLVWEEEGNIMGYAYAAPFKNRGAYDWAVETTIYVARDARHNGGGRRLYEALEKALKCQHITNLNACIGTTEREDEHLNNNSRQFHEHMGYTMVGTFHGCGYKLHRWYDMCWMEKIIGEHDIDIEPVIPFSRIAEKVKGAF